MSIDERYQAERAQSEKDHHIPTAGAMIDHILANLKIHRTKLAQAVFYSTGEKSDFIRSYFNKLAKEEEKQFDQLAELMLDEDEVIPTTTAEFTRYSMIEESGKFKYETSEALLEAAVADFNIQNMFLIRGIKLAEKEEKFALQQFLIQLLGWMKHQMRLIRVYANLKPEEADEE
ncbi:DNA-binding protein [Sporolactobacillus sp. THM7-4]|nr:DNA-binding protein [Sporolactobacillus sp. THM7-4]